MIEAEWQSLGHLLRERAKENPRAEFLRFPEGSLTYSDVEERTNRLANVLLERGVSPGDRVAVMMRNGQGFPLAWLAIAKARAVMVPVNPGYREADLTHVLTDSGASLVLAEKGELQIIEEVRSRCPSLREASSLDGLASEIRAASNRLELNSEREDLLNLQYTSGTTGFPKACMLTHDYFLRMGSTIGVNAKLEPNDVVLTAQAFSYIDPQWKLTMSLLAGATFVILPRFSASTFWRSIAEQGVTVFYVIATMPVFLLRQDPYPEEKAHKVRLVMCSGIIPQFHREFEERWGAPWREVYGMTETGVDLVVAADDESSVGSGTVGKPIPTKEAQIIREDGSVAEDSEVAELVVRGKPMMLGYWNNPEATAATMRQDGLHTGDLALRDSNGYFFLRGRIKDMIRRSGENISAAEVEGVLCEHPLVEAAAVVPVPDELRGEEVKAFIKLRPGHDLAPQDVIAFVGEKLARFKIPRFVEFVKEFPLTSSQRVAKHLLLGTKDDQRRDAYDSKSGAE